MALLQAIGACCPSKLAFHGMPVHQDNFGCLRKSCFHHEMGARSSGFCGQMMNHQELQQKHISWNQGIQNGVTGETNKDAVLSRKTDVLGSNNSGQLCEKLNKVVLGYIGGLDTSVIVPWLRIRLKVSQHSFLCKAKTDESEVASHHNFATIPSSLLTAEREEAKAVLTLFLKRQGLSNTVAARIINKSDCFVDHLILKLHSMHKSRYLVGRELTTLEIRGALIPYLESLLEEHGDALVDFVENFPDPPGTERAASTSPINSNNSSSKKERAVARVSQLSSDGLLPEHVLYLVDLGMNLEQIKNIARKFPAFAYYNLDRKIKPVVEFLLELGVPRSDIPTILIKRPQLCGISFSDNLKPMMAYLENLGVDKSKWAKVIYRFPALLTYSRQKVKATLDFLSELGVSEKNIGKILTRCPHIISYSVEDKLRPTADYFQSIGIDVASLMHKCPQTFGLSIEANLKPVTEFFHERGYSKAEVSTMVHRYGALYTFSLADNLIPKWNYFLTMDYPKSELVKFPHYFGYSLEERIKPRYSWVRECGVKLILNQVLSVSDHQFEKILEKKMDKLADAHFPQRKNSKNTS